MKQFESAVLIFPHHLLKDHPCLNKKSVHILIEHPYFFSVFDFHKQKIILHRASMKSYAQQLESKGYQVAYLDHDQSDSLFTVLKKAKIKTAHSLNVYDHRLEKELERDCKKQAIHLEFHESPYFLSSTEWIKQTLGSQKKFHMAGFYIKQRKRLNILVHNGKPVGGSWSFDTSNRKKIPSTISFDTIKKACPASNMHLKEAQTYVKKHFSQNPGETKEFVYPINHEQANRFLETFLKHRLQHFGDYQDAIIAHEPFLFHSVLSSSLNIGLLTPKQVVDSALAYAKKHAVSINNLEGFIRQIIGWREFVWGVYYLKGSSQRTKNFFQCKNDLPQSFWQDSTAIAPIDAALGRIQKYAYAHHIERLMVLGNFMLLCEINPDQVYAWFMQFFIDAYDWVMVPNIYGMSQYADGGLMTTKPYISGSNYIRTMSYYTKGPWADIWDSLYWRFIVKHRNTILKNPRLRVIEFYLKRMSQKTLQAHLRAADRYLAQLKKK